MAKLLTQHNTMSFNNFINTDLYNIIKDVKHPIRVLKNKDGDEYKTKVCFYFGGKDGNDIKYINPNTNPNECRLNGQTYCGILEVKVLITVEHDSSEELMTTEVLKLVKIPTMLHSDYCMLNKLNSSDLSNIGESQHEKGGYFIIKGGEKIILSQEDSAKNLIYTHIDNLKNSLVASINSDRIGSPPERFDLIFDRNTNTITARIPYLKSPIPLILLFRALGLESEKEILKCICGADLKSSSSLLLLEALIPSINEVNDIYNQEIALRTLSILTKVPAESVDKVNKNIKWKGNLLYVLNQRFLPHIKNRSDDYMESLNRKSYFLGYMTRVLIMTELGFYKLSDRDSLIYKSVRLPGKILNDMFREFYDEYLGKIKDKTDRILQLDKTEKSKMNSKHILDIILENSQTIFSNYDFQNSINRSFMGKWGSNPSSARNQGVLQSYLRHTFMEAMSHLRRVHLHLTDGPNTMEQRRLHNSQWGYFCPVETPDGGSIGQHKHFAQTCTVTEDFKSDGVFKILYSSNGFKDLDESGEILFTKNIFNIFVNGDFVGTHSDALSLIKSFRKKRHNLLDNEIHWSFSLGWDIKNSEIRILTTAGRLIRPLRLKGRTELDKKIELLGCDPELLLKNGCEYIDPNEANHILIGWDSDDLGATHFEISKTASLGLTALTLPFIEHNPIARNLYACQQSRASVSVYATNYNSRMDQKASLLHYGQCPIVHTGIVKKLNDNKAPYGINVLVAIGACNGYNQEDAIIINKAALERGLFTSSYYSTHTVKEETGELNEKNGKKSSIGNIIIENPKLAKKEVSKLNQNWDYSLLDDNGIIKEGVMITKNTVLIGAYMVNTKGEWIDKSIVAKNAHDNEYVERVHLSNNFPRTGKVLTREVRIPIVGDKFASRAAQKATIGIVVGKENMPYTKDGLTPDIIFNPHSFPSRMTIGYLLEMLCSNLGLTTGKLIEIPNFNGIDYPHEFLSELIEKIGGDPNSEYKLYSGITGKCVCENACIGPIFYQRLKQMVEDKIYARGIDGPKDGITKQPLGGRARGGGLKCGEMERDALLCHGMSQFVKEIYYDKSSAYEMAVSNKTGKIVPYNPDKGIIGDGKTSMVQVPYAFKLFLQEMYSMGISCNIGLED